MVAHYHFYTEGVSFFVLDDKKFVFNDKNFVSDDKNFVSDDKDTCVLPNNS
jgi:hypothetical protein